MVKHFDPTCPSCNKEFHVHHDDLRFEGVKLLCPFCEYRFYVEESSQIVEYDGTVTRPTKSKKT